MSHTFPQEADTDDAANFAEMDGRQNMTQYVENGMETTAIWGDPALQIAPGKCYISAPEQYAPRAEANREHVVNFKITFDNTQEVVLSSDSYNHIWIDANKNLNDSAKVVANTTGQPPSVASLKIATADTVNNILTQINRAPNGKFDSVETKEILGEIESEINFTFGEETTLFNVHEDPDNQKDTPYTINYEDRPIRLYAENADMMALQANEDGSVNIGSSLRIDNNIAWHAGNDGHNSHLDSDLVDGYHADELGALSEDETVTGDWNWTGDITRNGYNVLDEGDYINADELDGLEGSQFIRSDIDDTANGVIQFRQGLTIPADEGFRLNQEYEYFGGNQSAIRFMMEDNGDNYDGGFLFAYDGQSGQRELLTIRDHNQGQNFHYRGNEIWHAGNDGHNSGLAADTIGSYTTNGNRDFMGPGGGRVITTYGDRSKFVLNYSNDYDVVEIQSKLDMADSAIDNIENLTFHSDQWQDINFNSENGYAFRIHDNKDDTTKMKYGHDGEDRWDTWGGRWFFNGGSVYLNQTQGEEEYNDSYDMVFLNKPSGDDFRIHLKEDPINLADHRSGTFAQFFASDDSKAFAQIDINNDTFEIGELTNRDGGGTPVKRGPSAQYSEPGDIWFDPGENRFEGMVNGGRVVPLSTPP